MASWRGRRRGRSWHRRIRWVGPWRRWVARRFTREVPGAVGKAFAGVAIDDEASSPGRSVHHDRRCWCQVVPADPVGAGEESELRWVAGDLSRSDEAPRGRFGVVEDPLRKVDRARGCFTVADGDQGAPELLGRAISIPSLRRGERECRATWTGNDRVDPVGGSNGRFGRNDLGDGPAEPIRRAPDGKVPITRASRDRCVGLPPAGNEPGSIPSQRRQLSSGTGDVDVVPTHSIGGDPDASGAGDHDRPVPECNAGGKSVRLIGSLWVGEFQFSPGLAVIV